MSTRIVVLQRGWVVVGEYSQSGDEVTVSRSRTIRRWGTSKGLAELRNGPLASTQLDDGGTVRCHRLAIVMTIDCNPEKWARHLGDAL